MKLLLLSIISVSIPLSSCLFFGSSRSSSCRSDRDCPRLRSSGGRCLPSNDGWCGFVNIFRRNKENCGYNKCASCINDVDCSGDRYCSGFSCIQRQPNTTPSYWQYTTPYAPPAVTTRPGIPQSWGRGR